MQQLTLDNFRVFGDRANFDLAPVTVLTGKNNSGKSSLIKAILVLADYLEQDDQTVLRLDGPRAGKHKINSFNSLRNRSANKDANVNFHYVNDDLLVEYNFISHEDPALARLSCFRATILSEKESLTLKYQGPESVSQSSLLAEEPITGYFTGEDKPGPSYQLNISEHFIDLITATSTQREEPNQARQKLSIALSDVEQQLRDLERRKQPMAEQMRPLLEKQRAGYLIEIKELESRFQKSDVQIVRSAFVNERLLNGATLTSIIVQALFLYVQENTTHKNAGDDSNSGVFHSDIPNRVFNWRITLPRFGQMLRQRMRFVLFHVGANRTYQAPLIFNQQHGSELAAIVAPVLGTGFARRGRAETFLNYWLKEFEIGEQIEVKPVEGVAFKVVVKQADWINLVDLGYGAGQLITLLLQIATILQQAETGRSWDKGPITVLVEEPESNLHPKLQSLLALLFAHPEPYLKPRQPEAGLRRTRMRQALPFQFILETHSEYLIRRIQLLIAQGDFPTANAVVHYLDQEGNRRITIDEEGKLSQLFGSGFFDEAGEGALALLKRQREKRQQTQPVQ